MLMIRGGFSLFTRFLIARCTPSVVCVALQVATRIVASGAAAAGPFGVNRRLVIVRIVTRIVASRPADRGRVHDFQEPAAASQVGSDVSQLEERVRTLVAEKDQLVADLAQAKSAVEASERQLAATHAKIQELNSEKDQLAGEIAQAKSDAATAERELVAATSQVQKLTKEIDRLVAEYEKAEAQANIMRGNLSALDDESVFDFIRRRYFGRK
jgi:septal ring factor EnvC (AmiA/AmiB activator)